MQYHNHRSHFETQMGNLETSLLDLASRVEKAISASIYALKTRDHFQAQQVIANDRPLNACRYQIEEEALFLLALQQPVVSRDLRYIAAVMHIAGELERMGDYAKGIARISDNLAGTPSTAIVLQLEKMAQEATGMLHGAMDALIDKNVSEADRIAAEDDQLDLLYNQVYKQLLEMMFADNSQVDLATALLWAAHNLERMGDRVTNICERIRFVETGLLGDQPGFHQKPSSKLAN